LEYRFRNHAEQGSPMRQITLSTLEYPTEAKAMIRLQEDVLRIKGPQAYRAQNQSTLILVIMWNLGKLQVFPAGSSSPREPHEAGKTGTFGILSPCGDQPYLSSIW
jgi:hypothetical protein